MALTLTHTLTFEKQDCINCKIVFLVPEGFTAQRREDCKTFYCPNGHSMVYSKEQTEEAKLRRERDRLKQEAARLEDRARAAERAEAAAQEHAEYQARRAAAARGQVTRLKNRAAAGVCPCCNRTFVNLQRHMASKHAGFTAEDVQSTEWVTIQ